MAASAKMTPLVSAKIRGVMTKRTKRILQIASLPAIHLCLCAATVLFLGQDSWDWIFVTLVDVPVLALMGRFTPPPYESMTITIFGTIWWLCIGIAISLISDWLGRKRMAKSTNQAR